MLATDLAHCVERRRNPAPAPRHARSRALGTCRVHGLLEEEIKWVCGVRGGGRGGFEFSTSQAHLKILLDVRNPCKHSTRKGRRQGESGRQPPTALLSCTLFCGENTFALVVGVGDVRLAIGAFHFEMSPLNAIASWNM